MIFPMQKAESVLRAVQRWGAEGYFLGGGTDTAGALGQHFKGHNRVVILTDEQVQGTGAGGFARVFAEVSQMLPTTVPLHTMNLAGYARGHAPSGSFNRHAFGGLTDSMFNLIPQIEAAHNAKWPWEELVPAA
jgi:hypothetical protein